MQRHIIFLGLFFFATHVGLSQSMTGRDFEDHALIQQAKKSQITYHEVEGSPFLDENFVPGDISSFQGKYKGIPMRYNIFEDYIEFKQKDVIYILAAGHNIQKVILGNETFVVDEHEVKGRVKFGFLTLLDSGKVTLLSKKTVLFTPHREPKALESSSTPAQFTRANDLFYYKIGKGDVLRVGSLKNFIDSLPDKKEEMARYAKQE